MSLVSESNGHFATESTGRSYCVLSIQISIIEYLDHRCEEVFHLSGLHTCLTLPNIHSIVYHKKRNLSVVHNLICRGKENQSNLASQSVLSAINALKSTSKLLASAACCTTAVIAQYEQECYHRSFHWSIDIYTMSHKGCDCIHVIIMRSEEHKSVDVSPELSKGSDCTLSSGNHPHQKNS